MLSNIEIVWNTKFFVYRRRSDLHSDIDIRYPAQTEYTLAISQHNFSSPAVNKHCHVPGTWYGLKMTRNAALLCLRLNNHLAFSSFYFDVALSIPCLEGGADVLELLSRRYLAVDVVPRVPRGDQDGAHVLVAALQPKELLHQAYILIGGGCFNAFCVCLHPTNKC